MTTLSTNQEFVGRPKVHGDTHIYRSVSVHMGNVYRTETVATDGIGEDMKKTKTDT